TTISPTHPPNPTETYTLSLHDALPISAKELKLVPSPLEKKKYPLIPKLLSKCPSDFNLQIYWLLLWPVVLPIATTLPSCIIIKRSEEHTSELQSRENLVCRLLLEKKKQ